MFHKVKKEKIFIFKSYTFKFILYNNNVKYIIKVVIKNISSSVARNV